MAAVQNSGSKSVHQAGRPAVSQACSLKGQQAGRKHAVMPAGWLASWLVGELAGRPPGWKANSLARQKAGRKQAAGWQTCGLAASRLADEQSGRLEV